MSSSAPGPDSSLPPSLPEGYVVPEVWEAKPALGPFGGMNRPTAGARSEKELPRGEHALQLYSLGTPNGVKVTLLLEELSDSIGLEYDAWFVDIMQLDQFTSGFVAANPNSKIPALLDYDPENTGTVKADAEPVRVFESGAILLYLAEKYASGVVVGEANFAPHTSDVRRRAECLSWLMWQMSAGPIWGGGFGHFFNYAPVKIEYAIDRFTMETKRSLDVLDQHLKGKKFMLGDAYSVCDMAIWPWIKTMRTHYGGGKACTFLQLDSYTELMRWYNAILERPATKRGVRVNARAEDGLLERHSRKDFDLPGQNEKPIIGA